MKLENLIGIDVINLLESEEQFDEMVHECRKYRQIFRLIHNIYDKLQSEKVSCSDELLKKICMMDFIYTKILQQEEVEDRICSEEEMVRINKEKLSSMKTLDDIDSFYRYYKKIKTVVNASKIFSLDEQYTDLISPDNIGELNGVAFITPTQTIHKYNLEAGYHDENFSNIVESVYGKKIKNNYSGQDIKIRFVNSLFKRFQTRIMTMEIPKPINSSQKISLLKLNECIKKLNVLIDIEIAIIQAGGYTSYYHDVCNNLDLLLDNLVIDDYIEYENEELFYVGESNLEVNYLKEKKKII